MKNGVQKFDIKRLLFIICSNCKLILILFSDNRMIYEQISRKEEETGIENLVLILENKKIYYNTALILKS